MKIEQIQLDELKQGIVGEISALICDTKKETIAVTTGLFGKLKEEIEALAISTAKGFEEVHARFDNVEGRMGSVEGQMGSVEGRLGGIEYRLDGIESYLRDITVEVKLNHEETKALRFDMNKQFNQVNADIQLRRLLLD